MRFAFEPEQLAFAAVVRELLAAECPPAAVRAAWEPDTAAVDLDLWKRLAELGAFEVGPLDQVLVLEELGRACVPGPVAEHAAAVAMGIEGVVVTVTDRLERTGWVFAADTVLLLLDRGAAVVAVETVAPLEVVDRSCRDGAVSAASTEPIDIDARQLHDRIVTGTAALLCGLTRWMLDTTVVYVRQREQFGVPIGSFQAVKHHLADVALQLEHARPAVHRAAWSVQHDEPTRRRDASMAKVLANDAAARAARAALQCHGAIGYAWEHDLHLWMKRAWVLQRRWGDSDHHLDVIASDLGL